jgi:hypothetical protein
MNVRGRQRVRPAGTIGLVVVVLLATAGACGGSGDDAGSVGGDGGGPSGAADASSRPVQDSSSGSFDASSEPTSRPDADAGGADVADAAAGSDAFDASLPPDAGALFAPCSVDGGCIADCAPPASDPLATGNPSFDLYDGCLLAGMELAGMTEAWQGRLIKAQMYMESGITPQVTTNTATCRGENCGVWKISGGSVSGDDPPGPCGSSQTDPFTGQVDYSHGYGLFQGTPACDGMFGLATSLSGQTCTATTEADVVPFGPSVAFYCEGATSLMGDYIDAVQDTTSPLYAQSVFNPAYDIYVYFSEWAANFQGANASVSGCTAVQQTYLTFAYWLTGDVSTSCALTGPGQAYVQTVVSDYDTPLYGSPWPYPGP